VGGVNSREEDLRTSLSDGNPAKRLAAARGLWEGHSRLHSRAILQLVTDPTKSDSYPGLRQLVEDSLKPEAILHELLQGDYEWGAWLAFLRPHRDLVPALLDGLKNRQASLPETMLALGGSGDRRALEPLLTLLKRDKERTAGDAAQALGYLGAVEVEPKLIEALSRENAWLQLQACLALARIGSPRAIPTLERLVNDKRDNLILDIRSAAMHAIVGIEKREQRDTPAVGPGRIKLVATLRGHTGYSWALAFRPDGGALASVSDDRSVRLWDTSSGKCTTIIPGHARQMTHVAFFPDGKTLATAGWGDDGSVRLLDVATARTTATLRSANRGVTSLAVSPDGKWIAFPSGAHDDPAIRLWDVATGTVSATLPGTSGALVFSPDGKVLATSGKAPEDVTLWDVATRKVTMTFRGHTETAQSAVFSPDGRTLATCGDWKVRVWDVQTGKAITVLRGDSRIGSVSFSSDGRVLASGEVDGPVRLWDIASGRVTAALPGRTPVAFSPNGKVLATGSENRNTILLWAIPEENTPKK
jgi:WD40 repeat protein